MSNASRELKLSEVVRSLSTQSRAYKEYAEIYGT
jgi:hypothetical protein